MLFSDSNTSVNHSHHDLPFSSTKGFLEPDRAISSKLCRVLNQVYQNLFESSLVSPKAFRKCITLQSVDNRLTQIDSGLGQKTD